MKNVTRLFFLFILTACSGGTADVNLGAPRTDRNGNVEWLTLNTFQNTPENLWLKDPKGSIYTGLRTLSFTGTCLRSVQKIIVKIDQQTQSTVSTCGTDGNFGWTQANIAEGTHSFEFVAIDISKQEIQPTIQKTIVVDVSAPLNPVVTTNSGVSPYLSPTSNFTLQGTITTDTVSVVISGFNTTASISGNQFSAPIQVSMGQTLNLIIKATDFAGNTSSGTPFQISHLADQTLTLSGFTVTALGTPSISASANLERSSMDPQAGSPGDKASNGSSLYKMLLGFVNHFYR